MPLTAHQLTILRNYCLNNPGNPIVYFDLASLGWGIQANECACWRWATSGLGAPIIQDPAQAFSAVLLGVAALTPGSAWATAPNAQGYLAARHNEYQQYVANRYQPISGIAWSTWFNGVCDVVTQNAGDLGGLTRGAGPRTNGERYFLTMHYERTTGGANNAPNYTHWWLTIDLGGGNYVCIEMFPQSTVLTFRFNNTYAVNDNVLVEVTGLTANHLSVLNAVVL